MVAQTRTAGQPSPRKLKFHEKLTTKNLTTDGLQKRMKSLQTELAAMDQDVVDTASLNTVRKDLMNTSILLHKDRGVKAYAACCLADLLRLYAPDAPYTREELRDIFQFFFRQLTTGLKGPDSPYYNEYYHLLESLSTVKSVVLVCDLPNSDELMVEIFRACFGMVRCNLAKKVELFMADILMALVDECQSLPQDVLETIMAQFMDKNIGMDQPAYRLAVQVCNATADKLQRHVCQYFTDIIIEHSRNEEYEEMQTAHDLIKRLNSSCQSLLHNVVPQLEEELRVQDNHIRIMATQTLGEMFADKGGVDLAKKYPTTWAAWLSRQNDQAVAVRQCFVETAKGVLVHMTIPEQREQVGEALQSKLFDPEEKIRAAVCRLYFQLDYETALHHVSIPQLKGVANRGIDRRPSVQVEAMKAIGRLYSLAYPEIENNDPAAISHFSWIPQAVLHMAATSQEIKALAEQTMSEYVFPLPAASTSSGKVSDVDEVAWTDRFLTTLKFMDTTAVNTLLGLSGLKTVRPSMYERYLESCAANNGGIIDEKEDEIVARLNSDIKRLATSFPDPQKVSEDLKSFAKLNEGRLYKLLRTSMDLQTDLKSLVKSTSEFLRRLEQSQASLVPTMTIFLRRATLHIVNQSSIPTLIKRLQKGTEGDETTDIARIAKTWLAFVSKHQPPLYKHHVGELSKAIANEANPVLVEISLQAFAVVANWDEKLAPNDKRTLERLRRFVMDSNHRHAKFAARVLACTTGRDELCAAVIEDITEALSDAEPDLLAAHITVLAQLAGRASDTFEQQSDVITAYLLKHVLMAESSNPDDMDTDEEWVENDDMMPQLRAKVMALKVFRNRCLAQAPSENALDIARPVLKMLLTLLQYGGSLTESANDDPKTRARMRLQAATSLLRLATVRKFADAAADNFILLAITIQDPCYQVRMTFVNKLLGLLTSRRLPNGYNVIPFLSCHDPETDVIALNKAYITHSARSMPKHMRLEVFEMLFLRILHLLAHHPDFATTEEGLPDIAKYIEFYLDLVCTPENIALLYHLASKLKTVRDAEGHTYSEHLYAVSELAQRLLRDRAKSHGWPLETYPGKVKLPGDIFKPLPNPEAAREIVQTVYLPEEALKWLSERQSKHGATAKDKPKGERRAPAKRKAPAPKANGHAKKRRTKGRRRQAEESDDDDEDDDSEGSDEDEEDEEGGRNSTPLSEPESDDEEANGEREEKLGRGARTRAKARIKQQSKRSNKTKARAGSSDN